MIKYSEYMGVLILLVLCSISDIKEKKVYSLPCFVFMMIGIIMESMIKQKGILYIVSGMLPGVLIYIAGIMTGGGIGKGDAIIFIVTGVFIGLKKSLILLVCSLIVINIIGLFILIFRRGNMKTKIPFVPFILISFIALVCTNTL